MNMFKTSGRLFRASDWLIRGWSHTLIPVVVVAVLYGCAGYQAVSSPYKECMQQGRQGFAVVCRPLRDMNADAERRLSGRQPIRSVDMSGLGFVPVVAAPVSDRLAMPLPIAVVRDEDYEPGWLVAVGPARVTVLVGNDLFEGPPDPEVVLVTWRGSAGPGLMGPLSFVVLLGLARFGAWRLALDSRHDIKHGRWTHVEASLHSRLLRAVTTTWWLGLVAAGLLCLGLLASLLLPESRYGEVGRFWWIGGLTAMACVFLAIDAARAGLAWVVEWEEVELELDSIRSLQESVTANVTPGLHDFRQAEEGASLQQPFQLASMQDRECLRQISEIPESARIQLMVMGVPAAGENTLVMKNLVKLGLLLLSGDGQLQPTEAGAEILSMPPSLVGMHLPGEYAAPLARAQQAAVGALGLKQATGFTRTLTERMLKDLFRTVFADPEAAFAVLTTRSPGPAERDALVLWETHDGDIERVREAVIAWSGPGCRIVAGLLEAKDPKACGRKMHSIANDKAAFDRPATLNKANIGALWEATMKALKEQNLDGQHLERRQGGDEILKKLSVQRRRDGLLWLLQESWDDRNAASHDRKSPDSSRARWAVDTARMTAKLLVSAGVRPSL